MINIEERIADITLSLHRILPLVDVSDLRDANLE